MTRTILVITIVVGLVAGCGGNGGQTTTRPDTAVVDESTSGITASPPESTLPEMTPSLLGDLIGETYVAAVEDVVELVADRPDGPAAETEVRTLKERYIREFVELGKLREALEPESRSVVDARIGIIVNGISPDLFTEFQQVHAHYQSTNPVMADLVISFNIITQYSNFELLAQQDPEEAARVLAD